MSKRHKRDNSGIVFSTNNEYEYDNDYPDDIQESRSPENQQLRVWRDRKQRGGKTVTVVKGFVGNESDLKALGKILRSKCSAGGNNKDGEILIQGDHRDKVVDILKKMGYVAKSAGG